MKFVWHKLDLTRIHFALINAFKSRESIIVLLGNILPLFHLPLKR